MLPHNSVAAPRQSTICLNPICSWGVAEQPLKEFFLSLNVWAAVFLEAARKTELPLPVRAEPWHGEPRLQGTEHLLL